MSPIRLLIVDDHPLMREAIQAALTTEPDLQVLAEAADGAEAVRAVRESRPDVILIDLLLPGLDDQERVLAAVRAGALGYFPKTAPRAALLEAIRQVASGMPYLPPEIALKLMNSLRSQLPAPPHAAGPAHRAPERDSGLAGRRAHGHRDRPGPAP